MPFLRSTVRGFSVVSESEVDVFLEFPFSVIQWILVIWSLVLLPFLNPPCTYGSFQFTYCWSLAWKILSITLLGCEMSEIVRWFEHSLALLFFGIEVKLTFSSPVPTAVFQICWHVECSTLTASSLRILNSLSGIPSFLLALFVVMLPRAHSTNYSLYFLIEANINVNYLTLWFSFLTLKC